MPVILKVLFIRCVLCSSDMISLGICTVSLNKRYWQVHRSRTLNAKLLVKDEIFNMTQARDKEKSESPTRIEPMTSRTPGGGSIHWATRTHGSKVIILSSYVTVVLHTARISDKWMKMDGFFFVSHSCHVEYFIFHV